MNKNEDDFWNQSSSSGFNFCDDDDDLDSSFVEDQVFHSIAPQNTTLPIHSIISKKCLDIILDDVKSTVEHVVPPPDETIKRMFHNEKVVLYVYTKLDDKITLLNLAVELGDGNIILNVIIFLKTTLKRNIFLNQLSTHKVAVRHYANYLIANNNLPELADLFMATGSMVNLKDIYYLLCKDASNLHKKLNQFRIDHAQNLSHVDDLHEHISFLEWQSKNQNRAGSIIDELLALCSSSSDETIANFRQIFKIDDLQYDWVVMNTLCKSANWSKLISTFIKSGWMMKKRVLKSAIRPDLFILGLGRYKPPKNVIEQFLSCVGDVEKCLLLAQKLGVHSYVVNHFIEQRDKAGLISYMEGLEPGDKAMALIHSAMNNPDIKWKS